MYFTDETWFSWLTTFLPIYLVGVPLGYSLMRKVPADPASEAKKLGGEKFWLYALMCALFVYGSNILGFMPSSLLSGVEVSDEHQPLKGSAFCYSCVALGGINFPQAAYRR